MKLCFYVFWLYSGPLFITLFSIQIERKVVKPTSYELRVQGQNHFSCIQLLQCSRLMRSVGSLWGREHRREQGKSSTQQWGVSWVSGTSWAPSVSTLTTESEQGCTHWDTRLSRLAARRSSTQTHTHAFIWAHFQCMCAQRCHQKRQGDTLSFLSSLLFPSSLDYWNLCLFWPLHLASAFIFSWASFYLCMWFCASLRI